MADKDKVSITNNGLGHAVQLDDTFHEFFCHSFCSKRVTQSKEVGRLTQSIDHHHDGVLPLRKQ
jgi:hypothetical protein